MVAKHNVEIPPTPPDHFSVTVLNHKGAGMTGVYPVEKADEIFRAARVVEASYELLCSTLWRLLRQRRASDSEVIPLTALGAVLAHPNREAVAKLIAEFSRNIREQSRANISVALGKKRGGVFSVGTDGADLRALLRHGQKAGAGRMTVHRQREPETVNA